jgi:CheY-like chemotaxis protein
VSAASLALRESLLALSASSPERALPVELAEHCRSFEARTGVPARFVQLGPVAPLDAERTALLTAAVREGLLNVEKHAGAGTVVVSLGTVDGGVQVAVADDGGHPGPRLPGRRHRAGGADARRASGPARGARVAGPRRGRRHDAAHAAAGAGDGRPGPPAGAGGGEAVNAARVMVVDDHPVVRDGVALLLRSEPSLVVVGAAESGRAALERAPHLAPDLVLLDLRLPDMLAPEIVAGLRASCPAAKVVGLHRPRRPPRRAGRAGRRRARGAAQGRGGDGPRRRAAAGAARRAGVGPAPVPGRGGRPGGAGPQRADPAASTRCCAWRHRAAPTPRSPSPPGSRATPVKTYLQSALHKLGARNRVEAIGKASEAGLL